MSPVNCVNILFLFITVWIFGCGSPQPESRNQVPGTASEKSSDNTLPTEEIQGEFSPENLSFLLITLDTTRPDHLSPYGYAEAKTPNLQKLADEGIVFENAFATAPVTLPSHASLFTGLYPPEHGVRNNGIHYLDKDQWTIAELLSDHGFRTAAFISAAVLDQRYGLGQGFEVYDDDLSSGRPKGQRLNAERPAGETIKAALSWLEGIRSEEKFFLWVHLFDPHAPYQPPSEMAKRFADQPYDGEIAYLDSTLRPLLQHPKVKGASTSGTVVAVIGDHGEGLGEHRESTHAMLAYDTTIRIPWIFSVPGGEKGLRSSVAVSQVDLLPTLIELLGLEKTEERSMSGLNLTPILLHKSKARERFAQKANKRLLYAETLVPFHTYGWAKLYTLRTGDWKLIDGPDPELFNIHEDPGELQNLYREQTEKALELQSQLQEFLGKTDKQAPGRQAIDEEQRAKLASLGYLTSRGEKVQRLERPDPKAQIDLHEAVERAQHLFLRFELDEASRELRKVLTQDPQNLVALMTLAKIRAAQENFDQALELTKKALELDSTSPELYVVLGQVEAAGGNLQAALQAFELSLDLDQHWLDAQIERARVLSRLDRGPEAVTQLEEILMSSPNNARAHVGYAEIVELPAAEYKAAEQRLRRVTTQEPYLAEGWRVLGQVLESSGQEQTAIEVYQQGLRYHPRNSSLHARLGLLLVRVKPDGEAERHLLEAEKLSGGKSPSVYTGLAALYMRHGKWEAAEKSARQALEINPSLGVAWNYLAASLEEQGLFEQALSTYEKAQKKNPENWQLEFNKGLFFRNRGNFQAAAESFGRVLSQQKDHGKSHLELGLLYAGPLKNITKSKFHLRTFLELAPSHPRAGQIKDLLTQLP